MDVTTKVVQVVAKDPHRTGLLIYNNGTAAVYLLSARNMKAADGIPIAKGSSYSNKESTNAYWIVAESGTQNVRVEVVGG